MYYNILVDGVPRSPERLSFRTWEERERTKKEAPWSSGSENLWICCPSGSAGRSVDCPGL